MNAMDMADAAVWVNILILVLAGGYNFFQFIQSEVRGILAYALLMVLYSELIITLTTS